MTIIELRNFTLQLYGNNYDALGKHIRVKAPGTLRKESVRNVMVNVLQWVTMLNTETRLGN